MKIRAARSDDIVSIRALLAENELPVADVDAALIVDFLVAEDARGKIVGSVGLECFGRCALLRSLVVANHARNAGPGGRLLAHAENLARASGVSELWLLTTAVDLLSRAGYTIVERDIAPADLQASTQFSQLCPASAVCFKKAL
ncbi:MULTISPECIES: arsenic resistance N-acetyltransferase ArsN2 [unclassified Caballeronia]|uniref:arsenic resistance N-acetyltransferase ArsN2 n=1 Tax=unclassified Caballeronia TaxID=2646786 RepID=UPI0028619D22|nr:MULTISPECIES: arsenic resistance N-acetyltransferase ArsN2 [unclassified Caballeronia]MDR5750213.1 arsenic resistance N-acetyltransferase ArsN2 [Caballeronia sp. LZ024]MDR5842658.1 arsenic resistance N-acetyltransferase ArsN2 [Caballeronia sp. LZ031]